MEEEENPEMWMCDEILLSIAEFLDFKGLLMLFSTSKKSMKALKNKFTKESHPHALAYMTLKIFEARQNAPHPAFIRMSIRDAETIRFQDLDEDETGLETIFWARVADDRKSFSVQVSYVELMEGFTYTRSSIEVVVTPSETIPFRSGTFRVSRFLDNTTVETLDYADGFDCCRLLALCPLELPVGEFNAE